MRLRVHRLLSIGLTGCVLLASVPAGAQGETPAPSSPAPTAAPPLPPPSPAPTASAPATPPVAQPPASSPAGVGSHSGIASRSRARADLRGGAAARSSRTPRIAPFPSGEWLGPTIGAPADAPDYNLQKTLLKDVVSPASCVEIYGWASVGGNLSTSKQTPCRRRTSTRAATAEPPPRRAPADLARACGDARASATRAALSWPLARAHAR
jgi:hypothetical protein